MLAFWRRPDPAVECAGKLYAAAVAHARRPDFYRALGVPDTYDGRFDMVVLGVFALVHRLQAEGEPGHTQGRVLLETFFAAIDDDMREIGISDVKVPKQVLGAAAAFYGRSKAYGEALSDAAALTAALARNVYGDDGTDTGNAAHLARHLQRLVQALADQPAEKLLAGTVTFPDLKVEATHEAR
jgi:cytochrome b pre-mRNA-processing protein 3